MTRCLLYHTVRSGSKGVRELLREGVLTPPAVRVAKSQAKVAADYFFRHAAPTHLADPKLVKAVKEIYQDEAFGLPERGTKNHGLSMSNILAGDLRTIFFSPNGWYYMSDEITNGFVFRCKDMIELGACFRPYDFGGYVFDEILIPRMESGRSYRSVEDAKRDITQEIEKLHLEQTFCGSKVMKKLARSEDLYDEAEVVIQRPVPLDLAVEVWENDKRIS